MFKKRKFSFTTQSLPTTPSTNETIICRLNILSKKVDLIMVELKRLALQLNQKPKASSYDYYA